MADEPDPKPRPVPAHLFTSPIVVVSPRRVMDVPDEPGVIGADFEGCES